MSKNTLHSKLIKIQAELNAPKNKRNKFGNYNYRDLSGILEGLKPLLKETETIIKIDDEIIMIGDRYYVKATVSLSDGVDGVQVSAFAREGEDRKGMDDSQVTGSTSSYARKYACNGLFAIDDTADADSMDNSDSNKQENWMEKNKMSADQLIIINDLLVEVDDAEINEKTQTWLLGYKSKIQADKMITKLKGMIKNG